MIQWDESRQVFTDHMGVPLRKAEVKDLKLCIEIHLKTPPDKLAEYGNEVYAEQFPSMHRDKPLTGEDFE